MRYDRTRPKTIEVQDSYFAKYLPTTTLQIKWDYIKGEDLDDYIKQYKEAYKNTMGKELAK